MKSYKEMSDSVIKRVREQQEKKRELKKKAKKVSLITTAVMASMAISVGAAYYAENNGIIIGSVEIEKGNERPEYVDEEFMEIISTTECKTEPTEKETSSSVSETTTRAVEEEDIQSETQTNKNIPTIFARPQETICYYDGTSSRFQTFYANMIVPELTKETCDKWMKSVITENQDMIDNIKNNDRAIEFLYDDYQTIKFVLEDKTEKIYEFDRVLFVLSGDNQGTLIFGSNGEYFSEVLMSTTNITVQTALSYCRPEFLEN